MSTDIELIPISSDSSAFHCAILRIGNTRILLDCGWNESMDVSLYDALPAGVFESVDVILLSHYTIEHCGALPFLLFRSLGKKIFRSAKSRIIATEAVRRLGELTLASLHEDIDKVKTVTSSDESYSMTIEDIVAAFSAVQPVQFNEPVRIGEKISVAAHPAGRVLGGAYWVITVGSQRIVYAVDYSLVAGKAIGGLSPAAAKGAQILITDSISDAVSEPSSFDTLVATIRHTVRGGGSVLLPMDCNGRVLELLLALESAWAGDASLQTYPLIFLSPLGDVVLDQIKTRMEWMNQHVLHEFEESQNFAAHPFLFQHVQLCCSLGDYIEKFASSRGPKIVLATSESINFGDSRELFFRLASDGNNCVVLTAPPAPGSLAHQVASSQKEIIVQQFSKTPFSDEHLRQFYREALEKEAQDDELRRRRQRQPAVATAAPSSAAAVPVDLIRGHAAEGDVSGSYFRSQLFASQTVASGAVLKPQRITTDYGEQVNTLEVDTWRAHAEMSDVGAAREAAAMAQEQATGVKAERRHMKGEQMIKGDIDEQQRVKGEVGIASIGSESFDWRRDLQVRFGEPQRVEQRERAVKVNCKIVQLAGLDGQATAAHRREFISVVDPSTLIMLPTRNLQDLQLVALMMESKGGKFLAAQEDTVPTLQGEQAPVVPMSVDIEIAAGKRWLAIDPALTVAFKQLPDTHTRIGRLEAKIVGPMYPHPELAQVPSGDFVEFVLAPSAKRLKSTDSSLFVSQRPFKLYDFAKAVKAAMPDAKVEFVTTGAGRALSVTALGGQVIVTAAKKGPETDCAVVELLGTPSKCFYTVRDLMYTSSTRL